MPAGLSEKRAHRSSAEGWPALFPTIPSGHYNSIWLRVDTERVLVERSGAVAFRRCVTARGAPPVQRVPSPSRTADLGCCPTSSVCTHRAGVQITSHGDHHEGPRPALRAMCVRRALGLRVPEHGCHSAHLIRGNPMRFARQTLLTSLQGRLRCSDGSCCCVELLRCRR